MDKTWFLPSLLRHSPEQCVTSRVSSSHVGCLRVQLTNAAVGLASIHLIGHRSTPPPTHTSQPPSEHSSSSPDHQSQKPPCKIHIESFETVFATSQHCSTNRGVLHDFVFVFQIEDTKLDNLGTWVKITYFCSVWCQISEVGVEAASETLVRFMRWPPVLIRALGEKTLLLGCQRYQTSFIHSSTSSIQSMTLVHCIVRCPKRLCLRYMPLILPGVTILPVPVFSQSDTILDSFITAKITSKTKVLRSDSEELEFRKKRNSCCCMNSCL